MRYDVVHPGSNALVAVHLEPYEHIQAQAGAMVSRTAKVAVVGTFYGGIWRALKRSMLGGESLFFQELKAEDGEGEVLIAPAVPGDIKVLPLTGGQDYYIKNGSLLATFENVTIDTKMQKISRGLFSGAGLFVIHAQGEGSIAVSAFGALIEISVPAREKYIVDNGHLVAWFGDMEYRIVRGGKTWVSSVTSGEGLACEFTGPGKVWLQSRNPEAFGNWIKTFVPMRGGGISIF
jgi:uncharacterized protein (TIGR00266 family)